MRKRRLFSRPDYANSLINPEWGDLRTWDTYRELGETGLVEILELEHCDGYTGTTAKRKVFSGWIFRDLWKDLE